MQSTEVAVKNPLNPYPSATSFQSKSDPIATFLETICYLWMRILSWDWRRPAPTRRTRPELVSSYSHRRRIWGFFIIYCRSLSAFSSIEVYLTAISRTDLCTRHSTVQYSTVHRIQYNRFGKQRLLRMTLSLLKLPCASLTPDPVSYTHTHTRPATEPSATRRHVSCHVISGQPRPRLRSWSLLL